MTQKYVTLVWDDGQYCGIGPIEEWPTGKVGPQGQRRASCRVWVDGNEHDSEVSRLSAENDRLRGLASSLQEEIDHLEMEMRVMGEYE